MRSLLALALFVATPALADDVPGADIVVTGQARLTAAERKVPQQLNGTERVAYAQVFRDIETGRHAAAEGALAALPDGILTSTARAQIMLAKGLGGTSVEELNPWLAANADLPQAPKLIALAARVGAATPVLPTSRTMRYVSFQAPMTPRAAVGFGMPGDAGLAARIKPLLVADRNAEAEAAWQQLSGTASEPVATEWAQRTAWSYYRASDDVAARRMGEHAAQGTGEWAALGGWVAGLAAFRSSDCEGAARDFDLIATKFASEDLSAAGAYWASRAHRQCGRAGEAQARLLKAATYRDKFYALLAQRALGRIPDLDWAEPDFIVADWTTLSKLPGAKRAVALVEAGQIGLADRELKYLASTTDATNYAPLLRLAARLSMPATQYQLAHRPPVGTDAPLSARFPAPDWRPFRGWVVDRNLVFAHALQESNFVTTATSRAGARGVMQLMPATAKRAQARMADGSVVEVAAIRDLGDPAFNLDVGQTYLQELRDMSYTGGLLPKVIAAYNAGPGSVQKWNTTLKDNADPLLFIESIPFVETRHYVEVVLRNFWMYQLRDGAPTPSLDALAKGLWPKFPCTAGQDGVTIQPTYVAPPTPAYLAPPLPIDEFVVASTDLAD